MKKLLALILRARMALAFTACSSGGLEIAVPNDTTNEARALLLLEANGIIKLKEGAGITATIMDIAENPKNITFKEVEAAQIPNILKDVDYAVINSNYAIEAGLDPMSQSLTIEGSYSAYANIVAVKEGNENTPKIKALVAALSSQKVADFITATYKGAVVSTVDAPTDGFDASVDYAALAGQTITVAASPAPHAEILAVAKEILAEKNVTSKLLNSPTMSSPTTLLKAAKSMQTTSSTPRTSMTSTLRTARTSFPQLRSMLNPWVCTAASSPASTL